MQTKMTDQELDERVARAVDNFMQGYGCCQSVVAAFADLYGLDETMAKKIAAGFGGGVGRMRMMCGASKCPELFKKSANVYVRMTEEDVIGKSAYIKAFRVEDLESFRSESSANEE